MVSRLNNAFKMSGSRFPVPSGTDYRQFSPCVIDSFTPFTCSPKEENVEPKNTSVIDIEQT